MRIGILTFHCARNYGAVLQCRGLVEVLRSLGHEVHVIDYCPDAVTVPYRLWKPSFWGHPVSVLKVSMRLAGAWRREKRFRDFCASFDPVPFADLALDAVLFGSDQIWNPAITAGDPVYFGAAEVFRGLRKVAYAASSGAAVPDPDMLREKLRSFHRIGVREVSLQQTLAKAGIPSVVTLDPVLLAGDLLLEGLDLSCPVSPGYVFTYEAVDHPDVLKTARKEAAGKGLKVISAARTPYGTGRNCYGPEEFVALIRGAEKVVTTSFHAVALSILMQKDFVYVQSGSRVDDRTLGLLRELGEDPVRSLPRLREASLNFIKEALS